MERQIFFPFRLRKFLNFYLFWQVPLQVLRVEPADPLGAALADILEEAGTLVVVSQLTQQRLRLDLRHQSHVHRGQQDHESPWQLVWQDVKTLPYVSFIVPWLHLDSPANADVLEECGAGVGTQVIVTNQNADLSSQWLHSVCKILDSPFSTCTSSPAVVLSVKSQCFSYDLTFIHYHLDKTSDHAGKVLRHGPTDAEVQPFVPHFLLLQREHYDPGPAGGAPRDPGVVVLDEVVDRRTRVPVPVTASEVGGASVLVIDLQNVASQGPGARRDAVRMLKLYNFSKSDITCPLLRPPGPRPSAGECVQLSGGEAGTLRTPWDRGTYSSSPSHCRQARGSAGRWAAGRDWWRSSWSSSDHHCGQEDDNNVTVWLQSHCALLFVFYHPEMVFCHCLFLQLASRSWSLVPHCYCNFAFIDTCIFIWRWKKIL